jgi:hypothetical protein
MLNRSFHSVRHRTFCAGFAAIPVPMRTVKLAVLILVLMPSIAVADCYRFKDRAASNACWLKHFAIEDRIRETRPDRNNGPLRAVNINDQEVAEIQEVISKVLPESIVNISGITSGCPCEDGPLCTDQVWLLASRSDRTKELKMSKVDGHWVIGAIQQWWLRYEQFKAGRSNYPSHYDYWQAEIEIIDEFPACLAPKGASGNSPKTGRL